MGAQKLKGLRHIIQSEKDEHWHFARGFQCRDSNDGGQRTGIRHPDL